MGINSLDPQIAEKVAEYRESAKRNPVKHLANLLKHSVGYIVNKNEYYKRKKANFDKAMDAYKKGEGLKPIKDPFITNYELAKAEIEKILGRSGTEADELVHMTEEEYEKLAERILARQLQDEVKAMANKIWLRTIFPKRNLISNLPVEGGGRQMMFKREGDEQAESRVTIWPSGAVKVIVNGKEQPAILPPFPDIYFTHQ